MTRMEWFRADQVTAAGYAAGEIASDGFAVDAGSLAVEIEGPDSEGVILQGTKSELFRFATDIIEATLIAEARSKDRAMRLVAATNIIRGAKLRGEDLKMGTFRMELTPEQAAAFEAGKAGWDLAGVSIDGTDLEAHAAVQAEARAAAIRGDGKVGKYTYAELEAMPMTDYLEACADILGTTDEPA